MAKNKILEKFHNRKTGIAVKVFLNLLFVALIIPLSIFCYKDWGSEDWGQWLIFLVLIITFGVLFKKYLESFLLKKCHGHDAIVVVKSIINFLFIMLVIWVLVWFYRSLFIGIGAWSEIWHIWPFLIALFIFIWIFSNKFVNLIFQFSLRIDENMDSLPRFIEWKKTLVQYNLSTEITPSEAWFLLYWEANISNLLCIIYKWYNEKIIDIYSEDWKKYMEVIGKLKDNVPYYEKYLFQDMLENKGGLAVLNKYKLWQYNIDVNDLIFEKCRLKWYCNVKSNEFQKKLESIGIWLLVLVTLIYFIKDFLLFMVLFWWLFFIFIIVYAFSFLVPRKKYSFILTDKWRKMLSEIYWYKYYLENCEEEEINANIWEKGTYAKTLPYAIALKLNWKIISELC